ncbi:hypothetical protein J6W20_04715 [bacterium]|nr:hypothetical protein [bacterium]
MNRNGQIIAPNSADDSYITMNISNDDPLNLSNTSISLSTTAKTVATTNSFGENAYQINVKPGTKLTFTLNINKLTYKDFANSDYYINWYVQNPNTFQDELESIVLLSNASS